MNVYFTKIKNDKKEFKNKFIATLISHHPEITHATLRCLLFLSFLPNVCAAVSKFNEFLIRPFCIILFRDLILFFPGEHFPVSLNTSEPTI